MGLEEAKASSSTSPNCCEEVWTVRANSRAYAREMMQELKDGTQALVEGREIGKRSSLNNGGCRRLRWRQFWKSCRASSTLVSGQWCVVRALSM